MLVRMTRPHAIVPLLLLLAGCHEVAPPGAAGAIVAVEPAAAAKLGAAAKPAPTRSKPGAAEPSGAQTGKLAGITSAHNDVRAQVGVGALAWSNEIGAYAQAWAEHLAGNGCQLAHHSGGKPYGENLFWGSQPSTAAAVVTQWAAERSAYDHATGACSGTCGHYTQLVWSKSTALGCGVASCAGGGEIWVCNYDPAGNVMGEAPY